MSNEFRKTSNVRQLDTSTSSHQNQLLSALDVLGAKLVRSESERQTMRKLLNEALNSQDRLETQMERSHIDIQRRIDMMERVEHGMSDDEKQTIIDQQKIVESTQEQLDDQQKRQRRVEDKLRDSQQTITKLQRRLDSQEQKRTKLQRRIERVENIASDAQNALEAKALVLLTDQSQQVRSLTNIDATAPIQILNDLHNVTNDENSQPLPFKQKILLGLKSQSTSWLAILVALGLGWGMATSLQPSEKAFVIMQDGKMAQVDLSSGQAQTITFDTTPRTLNIDTSLSNDQNQQFNIEDDINVFATDWITESILDESMQESDIANTTSAFDVLETVTTPELTMDKDLSLPADIKLLEEKAFAKIPEAQHDLAALYTAGQAGVTQNYTRAAFWFRQAADQGIGNAAYNLGVLFQQGLGQAQNLQRALDWYRRAAQLGHPEAQYNLGIAYIEGVGTRYNPNMAAAFFQQASYNGIVEAAYNLGLILENGLLGEIRSKDALIWYRAAAENGNKDAARAFKTLATSLNLPLETAGLLENGEGLAQFINPMASLSNDASDMDLGALVPSSDQILIAQIQEQLRKARLYNGPQDGIVGAGTIKAIKSYQRKNNIPVDGNSTQDLLTLMLQQGTG